MKRLLIPVLILIVIGIIWVVQSKLESRKMSARVVENFLELKADDFNRISLKTARGELVFNLVGGRWMLDGQPPRPVDIMAMNNLIETATKLKVGSVISENPERQREFQVDTLTGNLVQFFSGEKLQAAVIIGKMTSDFTHTYLRKPDSREVYLGEGMMTYVFNRDRTQWLDKTIFSFDPSGVKEVTLTYPDKSYRLAFHAPYWYISKAPYSDSAAADSLKIAAYVAQLSRLEASDYTDLTDGGKVNFDKMSFAIGVLPQDGSVRRSATFADTLNNIGRFYCRLGDSPDTLVVFRSMFESLKKDFSSFMPD